MLEILKSLRWQDIPDILIVWFLIYRVLLIIRGTRAAQMLAGIAVIIITYFGAKEFELLTLYWLLNTFLSSIFLIIIIVFQRDIRRALTQVGQTPFTRSYEDMVQSLEEIVGAASYLSRKRIGALMILERETGLKDYIESGHNVDARVSRELLVSLFLHESPLHDGGVVIRQGRILTAGCVLPLTKNPYISKRLGTRHRAAIGLSEETDAVILVVSEETGHISLVQHGAITTDLDEKTVKNRLRAIFVPQEYQTNLWKSWLNRT
ncbi:MAG: diadenylate cyclase CdaA [Proteobacteria bacterium]|nr:diadenylate cyclase CdaA [Pseudomonadota bacterium]MBU1688851.1 diadenylate cyclase CdaA [Pseudomonadota bacterium]